MTNSNKLADALRWFLARKAVIQAKFDLHGPADITTTMREAYLAAEEALAERDAQPACRECGGKGEVPTFDGKRRIPCHICAPQPAPAPVQGWPDNGVYLVHYDDRDQEPVLFAGVGARDAAAKFYADASLNWNAHLFVKIDSNSRCEKSLNAHPPAPAADGAGELPKLPGVCDGKEQNAFEAWAKSQNYDMQQHPLHYLFLDNPTYHARDGWKAGLVYGAEQTHAAIAALRQPVPDAVRELPKLWYALSQRHADEQAAYVRCAKALESALASRQESRNAD